MRFRFTRITGILFALILTISMMGPVVPTVKAAEFQYAYSMLTPVQQYTYDRIVACVESRKDSFELDESKGVVGDDIQKASDAVLTDHPEFFWFNGVDGYSSYPSGVAVSFTVNYVLNGVKIDGASVELTAAMNAFKNACNDILDSIPLWATSDYDKALYLHDTVARKVTYTSSANAHNAYGALVEGKAVCDGYSEAYQYLLNQKGINASKVVGYGDASNGERESHAWNIVWIDGKCVYTDVTWDDQGHSLFHAYFNRSLAVFNRDHIAETSLPPCNHEGMDYFSKEAGRTSGVGILSSQTTPEDFEKMFQPYTAPDGRQQLVCQVRCDNITVEQWLKDNNTDFIRITGVSLESYGMTICGDESQIFLNCRDTNVPVNGITLTTTEIHLSQIGAARQIGFRIMPINATNQKVTYRSSNPLVAVVDASGIVHAISSGTAEITVTTNEGGFTAVCMVTVDLSHVHDDPMRQVAASAADCTNDGNETYYVCDSCDSWFYDREATDPITDHESVMIPSSGHKDANSDGICDVCGIGEGQTVPSVPATEPSADPTEPESLPPATTETSPDLTENATQPSQPAPSETPGQEPKPQEDLSVWYIAAGAILAAGAALIVFLRKRS